MQSETFEINEYVIKQGSLEADTLYLVESGELNCYKNIENEEVLVK